MGKFNTRHVDSTRVGSKGRSSKEGLCSTLCGSSTNLDIVTHSYILYPHEETEKREDDDGEPTVPVCSPTGNVQFPTKRVVCPSRLRKSSVDELLSAFGFNSWKSGEGEEQEEALEALVYFVE